MCKITWKAQKCQEIEMRGKKLILGRILYSVTLTKTWVCLKTCFSSVTEPPATQIGGENPFSAFPCFPSPILVAVGSLTLLKLVLMYTMYTYVLVSVTGQIISP